MAITQQELNVKPALKVTIVRKVLESTYQIIVQRVITVHVVQQHQLNALLVDMDQKPLLLQLVIARNVHKIHLVHMQDPKGVLVVEVMRPQKILKGVQLVYARVNLEHFTHPARNVFANLATYIMMKQTTKYLMKTVTNLARK